mmetsp:Transcript_20067/g.45495  ORF Transcript_20067/g.45495 Transcript_20067/m.45495 type:complete len:335 (-) Transcript_20067:231-1235(-)|eukprot:CAMPEP_0113297520 /NCGR_PEP_ID=MMETSP0010_2-20120614/345_1 /TAXON_ID=216773 ORGANISM="Corethron hystrix, Strain 308" /NCGR_SAMPLE_ID=MMETSP0010_2 /ASSEMBLY_ACC=CAM_ASM_000155 /LENGTH=334 /DNA_ID=CAMNT_0000150417 /DNA_START=313 /DNA_END=1320 /DNA_ORIENTATION=- /assembly_acc=CAM_ASM_000155
MKPANTHSEVYDRQIRLWGVEAQSKMSSASVLYIGITCLSTEILKNLALAGVRCTITDGRTFPQFRADGGNSFLVSPDGRNSDKMVADIVLESLRSLNPLLFSSGGSSSCRALCLHASALSDAEVAEHDVVVCSTYKGGPDVDTITRLSKVARGSGRRFIMAEALGMDGVAVLDYGSSHLYRREAGKNKWTDEMKARHASIENVMANALGKERPSDRWDKFLPPQYVMYRTLMEHRSQASEIQFRQWAREWLKSDRNGMSEQTLQRLEEKLTRIEESVSCEGILEVPVVCAVLGGVLGQEIIKAITRLGEPSKNLIVFDGVGCGCKCMSVGEEK